jgi:L-asparaginase
MKSGEALPSIALVVTGGTIATAGTASLDLATYHETGEKLTAQGLVDRVPEFASVASVHPVEFRRLSSTAITVSDWMELRLVVEALLTTHDGVVIAHGTNTLEETAYFLDLCLSRERPVVVVGAMRPLSALSSDAALNLVRAVQVAGSPDAAGHGVLVVVNEQVFGARDVTKSSSQRVDAFTAPGSGPIGSVDPCRPGADRTASAAPGSAVRPSARRGPSQGGHRGVPRRRRRSLDRRRGGCRCPGNRQRGNGGRSPHPAGRRRPLSGCRQRSGGVSVQSGAGRPGGPDPGTAAFVAGRGLSPWKARVLLSLALISTSDPDVIQRMFDQA